MNFWALAKAEKLLNKAQAKQSVFHCTDSPDNWTCPPPPHPIVRAPDYDQTHSRHRQLAEIWLGWLVCWSGWGGAEAINFGRQLLCSGALPPNTLSLVTFYIKV